VRSHGLLARGPLQTIVASRWSAVNENELATILLDAALGPEPGQAAPAGARTDAPTQTAPSYHRFVHVRPVTARSLVLLAAALVSCGGRQETRALPPRGTLIAHALGGIGGVTYSNSREAFELWYGRGRRWFEADLALTADRQLVCFHSGVELLLRLESAVGSATLERFLSWRVAGTYTPLSLRGLLELLRDRPDAFVFLDPGMLTPAIVEGLHAAVDAVGPKVRRQLLVEFYAPEDLAALRESEVRRGRFGAVVLATYQWGPSEEELVRLVTAERIPVVVLGSASASRALVERLHGAGARVVLHTVNDPALARAWLAAGVDGLMTDFLSTAAAGN